MFSVPAKSSGSYYLALHSFSVFLLQQMGEFQMARILPWLQGFCTTCEAQSFNIQTSFGCCWNPIWTAVQELFITISHVSHSSVCQVCVLSWTLYFTGSSGMKFVWIIYNIRLLNLILCCVEKSFIMHKLIIIMSKILSVIVMKKVKYQISLTGWQVSIFFSSNTGIK